MRRQRCVYVCAGVGAGVDVMRLWTAAQLELILLLQLLLIMIMIAITMM